MSESLQNSLPAALKQKIDQQIQSNSVLLYMKGDRSFPQCGFSARVVDILESLNVNYETFDILEDPEMREGLKIYSQWPTFPQLYVKGELVGGCDIVTALHQSGDLQKLLKEKKSSVVKPVRVYVKDYCPYCTRAKALLQAKSIPFETINIENDPEFAQKLFAQTGFRTVPQIFIGEKCIGGYTDLASLESKGELDRLLQGE